MLCPLLISAWGKKTFLVHHSYEKDDDDQSVTQAVWKKKMQITIGVEAMNFCLCH